MLLRSTCKAESADKAMAKVDKGNDIGIEEIDDFIDENPVDEKTPLSTMESNVKKAEELRFSIRLRSKEEGCDPTNNSYATVMTNIKRYIKQIKQSMIDSRAREDTQHTFIHGQSVAFEINYLTTKLMFVKEKMVNNMKDLSDDDVIKLKTDAVSSDKVLEKVSERIVKLIASSNITDSKKIDEVKKRYEEDILLQKHFFNKIDSEYKSRELGKLKTLNQSKLNIKLAKFKGYNSTLDIYSFKRDFDKLHERSVPTNLMADVLKNNFLKVLL